MAWAEPVKKLQAKYDSLFWDIDFLSFNMGKIMVSRKEEGTRLLELEEVILYAIVEEVR